MSEVRESTSLRTILLVFAPCLMSTCLHAYYGGGTGTSNDPYLIQTAAQLSALGSAPGDWDKHFKLMANLDLAAYQNAPFTIGTAQTPFRGVFDGAGHTIARFSEVPGFEDFSAENNEWGLFRYVSDSEAEIRNLGLVDPVIKDFTLDNVGALVGYLREGTLTNCYVTGGSVAGPRNVGALVGYNKGLVTDCYATSRVEGARAGGLAGYNEGVIHNCHASGSVSGGSCVGGLVGYNYSTITQCYASGAVSGGETAGGLAGLSYGTIANCCATGIVLHGGYAGGLVGMHESFLPPYPYFFCATITNCYATGAVSGSTAGGLVGRNGRKWGKDDYSSNVSCCYAVGRVSSGTHCGGLIGVHETGVVEFSFWDAQTSGLATSAGGTGKTTAEMKDPGTFAPAGWDFYGRPDGPHDVWAAPDGGYPILWWQMSPAPLLPGFAGGNGEPNDPYRIMTAEQLNKIGHNPRLMKAHFLLLKDIDLTGVQFFPIGSKVFPFAGVFDGRQRTISHFTHIASQGDYVGLFAYVSGTSATIRDLGLTDPQVTAGTGNRVGALVGYLEEGMVDSCFAQGGAVTGTHVIGGLVGYAWSGTVRHCEFVGAVSGNDDVGGLAGFCAASLEVCAADGEVHGQENVGGLVGENWGGNITNCYALTTVTGDSTVGGLVGLTHSGITNCYAAGRVVATTTGGGLVGKCYVRTTTSFWDIETSGQPTSASGVGKTTIQMKTPSTFLDAGWDFVGEMARGTADIWWIEEGQDYPRLTWELESSGSASDAGPATGVAVGHVREPTGRGR